MISIAIEQGNSEGIKDALSRIDDINEPVDTPFGPMAPILYLCRMSHTFKRSDDVVKCLELMVEHGANIDEVDEEVGNCFNMVFHSNSLVGEKTAYKITKFLLEKNVLIEEPSTGGLFTYPVAVALSKTFFSCVELFVEYGCDLRPKRLGIKKPLSEFLKENYPEASLPLLSALIKREMTRELEATQVKVAKKFRI